MDTFGQVQVQIQERGPYSSTGHTHERSLRQETGLNYESGFKQSCA